MDKLKDIKPGDRVRVTFEGVVKRECRSTGISILLDGSDTAQQLFAEEVSAPTFHIERLEKPLEQGDKVRVSRTNWVIIDVRSIADFKQAVVWNEEDGFSVFDYDDLERIA